MINKIETINRLLESVCALRTEQGAKMSDASMRYSSQYRYAVRDSFDEAVLFGVKSGLLNMKNERISITRFGEEYLDLGDSSSHINLEPNSKQILFLNRKIFLGDSFKKEILQILELTEKESKGIRWIFKTRIRELKNRQLFDLLLQTGLLVDKNNWIITNSKYSSYINRLFEKKRRRISIDEFLKTNKKLYHLSVLGEKFVLQYEKKRLEHLNAFEQINKIEHTSQEDVGAGYDITSFDGPLSKTPDRFIEVKVGKEHLHFFLTINERKVAQREKNRYWLYYVLLQNQAPSRILLFQNPELTILKNHKKYNVTVSEYEITEV